MSETNKDELIEAQKQIIGVLLEVVKRLQKNSDLDQEYFQLVSSKAKKELKKKRLAAILKERQENGKIVTRLLKQLEI
jgi:hypothetical protein